MPINFDLTPIPDTLAEAIDVIVKSLTDEEADYIRSGHHPAEVHHSIGQAMRNGWQLWHRGGALHEHFRETYGLGHADDMSGLILSGVWAKVCCETHDIAAEVEAYKKHWRSCGQDPLMGE